MESEKIRSAGEIFSDYFSEQNQHVEELKGMIQQLKPIFESDNHTFYVIVFSLVTRMGIERPDFALDMMMSWMRGKGIELLEVRPEAFGNGVKFDS